MTVGAVSILLELMWSWCGAGVEPHKSYHEVLSWSPGDWWAVHGSFDCTAQKSDM